MCNMHYLSNMFLSTQNFVQLKMHASAITGKKKKHTTRKGFEMQHLPNLFQLCPDTHFAGVNHPLTPREFLNKPLALH